MSPVLSVPAIARQRAFLKDAEWRIFRQVYMAFLAFDDPYLEADQLVELASENGWDEQDFREMLERFGRLGLLRVAEPASGVAGFGAGGGEPGLELVETTFAGLETFCRAGQGGEDFLELLRAVAHRLVADRPATGFALQRALFAAGQGQTVPGLMLAHAVEVFTRAGLVDSVQQWAGPLGFQLGRVSAALCRWVASDAIDDATPAALAA
ncbi:MAG: hypothetical protein JO117_06100 [Verrucomicrobia bacterium]|nr:hypothetical protein [Verrucomicrobiota bacterium]